MRPQLGECVDAVRVREGDESIDDVTLGLVAHPREQGGCRGVCRTRHLRRIGGTEAPVEGGRGPVDGAMVFASRVVCHRSRLPAPEDGGAGSGVQAVGTARTGVVVGVPSGDPRPARPLPR
jgi:hypothetical protein